MAKFVVVIPAYNAARFLPEAVASVQAQDAADWEAIIVDDGSTDDTAAVAARLAAEDGRVRWLSQPNAGVSAARNFGARELPADCRYVWFLDADDMLAPGALRRLGNYLDAHSAVGLAACQFQLVHQDGTPAGTDKRSRWAPGGPLGLPRQLPDGEVPTPFETFFCGTGQGPFALYRRSVYERTEGWEPRLRFHEDTDMFCQMALLAPVHFLPERLYVKRVHPAQSTHLGDGVDPSPIWDHYARFREKWDQRPGRDAREARALDSARRFYRNRFGPARDMKLVLTIWRDQLRGRWNRVSALYSLKLAWQAGRALLRPAS